MKRQILAVCLALCAVSLSGCASYNDHIRKCDGDVSTAHLVFDYLPIGAVIDNGICAGSLRGTDDYNAAISHDADQTVSTPVVPATH